MNTDLATTLEQLDEHAKRDLLRVYSFLLKRAYQYELQQLSVTDELKVDCCKSEGSLETPQG